LNLRCLDYSDFWLFWILTGHTGQMTSQNGQNSKFKIVQNQTVTKCFKNVSTHLLYSLKDRVLICAPQKELRYGSNILGALWHHLMKLSHIFFLSTTGTVFAILKKSRFSGFWIFACTACTFLRALRALL